MKKRFLPIALLSLLVFGLSILLLIPTGQADKEINQEEISGAQNIAAAKAYLASIRNNQHTGVLDPKDVIASREQAAAISSYKSTQEFTWEELGPDNMGGRTRALIFDNQDASAKTIYIGSVTGGLFKSVNQGSTWFKINNESGTANLNVTCMVQADNGTIYVGTGEGLGSENYTAYGELGYEGGFVGKGIFKSNNNDNFTLVPGTKPNIQGQDEVTEWAYINELAIDKSNNRLLAATHTGLKYASLPNLGNWSSEVKYKVDSAIVNRNISIDSVVSCDSFEIQNGEYTLYGSTGWEIDITASDTGNIESVFSEYVVAEEPGNCYDVKVSDDGIIYSVFFNRVYVSESGNPGQFENRSIYPENPDYVRNDVIQWSSNVKIMDKSGNVLHEASNITNEETGWHTDYQYSDVVELMEYPHSSDAGRIEYAIAPSAQNVVYAMAAKGNNPNRYSLLAIYRTEDNGRSWNIVAPGGSDALNILGSVYGGSNTKYYQGDYCNTLAVFPNNPYKILAGGINLWRGEKINETGYYQWSKKSESRATQVGGIFSEFYCHADHHAYVFRPTNSSQVFIATDGGIFLGNVSGTQIAFQAINKNYSVAQFYSLDISNREKEFLGGAQDIGTVYVSGSAGTGKAGEDIYRPANFPSIFPEGTDGGAVAFATLRYSTPAGEQIPPPVFYTKGPLPQSNLNLIDRARRSETLGFDYSLQFLSNDIDDDRFITPMLLWESYNNQESEIYVEWVADADYEEGDTIIVRSVNYLHPFNHFLEEAVNEGDTVLVRDIISNKLFIGIEDEIYMTLESAQFDVNPEWFMISDDNNNGFEGTAQSMAYSSDANYLWVGSNDGRLFRISNIANAYDFNTADVTSENCIIATTEVILPGEITQAITSVSVDQRDPDKVLVTLGNYGNDAYVFYCTNGTADAPEFTNVQGNLPKMPVYASVLELDESTDQAIIGTEMGVYVSDNVSSGEWYSASGQIGDIPVMAIRQQDIYKGSFTITYVDPGTGVPSYEIYKAIDNYGDVYVATHGRGVFRMDMNYVSVDEHKPVATAKGNLIFSVYPNPAVDQISVQVESEIRSEIMIELIDLSGKIITAQSFTGVKNPTMDISSLSGGTYILKVTSGNDIGTQKVLVSK